MSNYETIRKNDMLNGYGFRTSIFFCGCEHFCKNCFNESIWGFETGKPFTQETINEILDSMNDFTAGISILGGEPMHPRNIAATAELCKQFKAKFPNKNIWLWSGYKYEQLTSEEYRKLANAASANAIEDVFSSVDVLIDGKFIEDLKDVSLKWRGSSNQRIIDLQKTKAENKIILFEK